MFVLAIDTSSPAVTAGVGTADGALLATRSTIAPRGHGELLTPSIAGCLHDAGLQPSDVEAVVAGTGPGPYTGLRVGLVTAAAFADALGVPTYGVCSLDAIGAAAADEPALLVVTDARRREVYWARYESGTRIGEPGVDHAHEVALDGVTAVAGAGVELHEWPVRARPERHPEPAQLIALAADRIRAGGPSEPLTPLYLRHPDAVVPGAPKRVRQ